MKTRKIFHNLLKEIDNNQIILLIGARQVGKTTLMKQVRERISKSYDTYFLNLEDPDIKSNLNTHPNKLFDITGTKNTDKQVIFIDEIQYLDNPTNFLKYIFDEYKDNVKLYVSGSSSFYIDQKFKDSLIGRKKVYNIHTLDFEEFLDFKNENNLKRAIFQNKKIPILEKYKLESLFIEYITYSGYPEIVLFEDFSQKINRLSEFTLDYIKKDIYDSNIADIDKFLNILKTLANQTGELLNMSEIANSFNLSLPTVEKYIYIMQKSFHIALIRPFYSNIRKELSKMPKVYFYDLGFRNSLLKNFDNINNRLDKGGYLENIVWREFLFTYGLDNIKYWRTISKNEVDFIINDNKAYESKFSEKLIKESKYKSFTDKYPSFDLEFITYNNLFEKMFL
ncbi:MAG: ATP-binding protein [Candidatus Absconditabacteria bacterium]